MVGVANSSERNASPEWVPCSDVVKSISYRTAAKLDVGMANAPSGDVLHAKPGWGVQLVGGASQASALASFQQLQKAYKTLFEHVSRPLSNRKSEQAVSGIACELLLTVDSDAERLCSGLRAAGGSCLVQRN